MVAASFPAIAYNEIGRTNFNDLYHDILDCISNASYVAIDTEFTGHCHDLDPHMEQRYEDQAKVVRSHAIVSFGMTTIEQGEDNRFKLNNFEFLAANQDTFSVDPRNMVFLAENGLDFNRHFTLGIPYRPGNHSEGSIREFWKCVLGVLRDHKVPIVVHNGFLDLMYIYQSFVCELPTGYQTFVADLVDMFPGGIYDTKHLVTNLLFEEKHWLAYLYCKFGRLSNLPGATALGVEVQPALKPSGRRGPTADDNVKNSMGDSHPGDTTKLSRSQKRRRLFKAKSKDKSEEDGNHICIEYARHGFCRGGRSCPRSHDIQLILDQDLKTPKQRSTPDAEEAIPTPSTSTSSTNHQPAHQVISENQSTERRDHAAHFDAYMTGFVFCYLIIHSSRPEMEKHMNKVYLMRHRQPLNITKSIYAKSSKAWMAVKKDIDPQTDIPPTTVDKPSY